MKITRKKTYEEVRRNSAHVHSILRIFSPVLAGEHAGKARKSSLDLTFRLPKYQVSAAERKHMQLGNVLRVTCISDLPLVLKRWKLHECQVRTQRVKNCDGFFAEKLIYFLREAHFDVGKSGKNGWKT